MMYTSRSTKGGFMNGNYQPLCKVVSLRRQEIKEFKGKLHDKVKRAVDNLALTGDLRQFATDMANAGDVNYQFHKDIVFKWINHYIPNDAITNIIQRPEIRKALKLPEEQ
jgi:hypothetical protein